MLSANEGGMPRKDAENKGKKPLQSCTGFSTQTLTVGSGPRQNLGAADWRPGRSISRFRIKWPTHDVIPETADIS